MIWTKKSKILINKTLNHIQNNAILFSLKCRKNTENKNPEVVRTKNERIMLLSNWVVCNSKKSKFIKG